MLGAAPVVAAPRQLPEAVEQELAMLEAQRRHAEWVSDVELAAKLDWALDRLRGQYGVPAEPEPTEAAVEDDPLPAAGVSDALLPADVRDQLAQMERHRQEAEEAGQDAWAEQLAQRIDQIRVDYGAAPPWLEAAAGEDPQQPSGASESDKREARDIRGVRYDVRDDLPWFGDIRDDVRGHRAKDLRSIPGEHIRTLAPPDPPE